MQKNANVAKENNCDQDRQDRLEIESNTGKEGEDEDVEGGRGDGRADRAEGEVERQKNSDDVTSETSGENTSQDKETTTEKPWLAHAKDQGPELCHTEPDKSKRNSMGARPKTLKQKLYTSRLTNNERVEGGSSKGEGGKQAVSDRRNVGGQYAPRAVLRKGLRSSSPGQPTLDRHLKGGRGDGGKEGGSGGGKEKSMIGREVHEDDKSKRELRPRAHSLLANKK